MTTALPPLRGRGRSVPAPAWDRARPYLTHGALRASAAAAAFEPGAIPDPPLSSYPAVSQDAVAADDVLSALLGVPGAFVRPRLVPRNASSGDSTGTNVTFVGRGAAANDRKEEVVFDFDEGVSAAELGRKRAEPAIPALAQKVLSLANDHAAVVAFVERCRVAAEAGGYVKQALGVAIGELLEDYRSFVVRLESALRKGDLSLQRLLFYVQPSMRSMALLRRIVDCVEGRSGGAALDSLYGLAAEHVGSSDAATVLAFLVERAAAPVLDCMHIWMSHGEIDDKYREFFVEENTRYARAKMRDDPTSAKSWDMRYTINRDNVPAFLSPFVEKILRAGKYLNVLRESARTRREDPRTFGDDDCTGVGGSSENRPDGYRDRGAKGISLSGTLLLGPDAARRIAAIVDKAYVHSTSQLMKELREKINFMARLRSIKRYFVLEQGDFLVHFFDAAADELAKSRDDVSHSRLSSLLELSVRMSVSAADPFHDDLECTLFDTDLTSQILSVLGSSSKSDTASGATDHQSAGGTLTGYDTFALDYSVSWPMSLIVSGMEILKYQLLFRYLFHCKHVERELEGCWRSLAQVKASHRSLRYDFARTFALGHRMLQFLRGMLYYVVTDVLEPSWLKFEAACDSAETIDEIIAHHSAFLDSCLSQCLLSNERHLRVFHNLTKVCLVFTSYTSDFTSQLTRRTSPTQIVEMMKERDYAAVMDKIEKTFDENLRAVLDGLSAMSKKRASTHLANLCDSLDFVGFYERAAMEATAGLQT